MGNANIEISNCKINEVWWGFSEPINEAAGVEKWGEYTVQCYLNAASDSCGHLFCDQMVLESSGGPTVDASCEGTTGRQAAERTARLDARLGKSSKGQSATAPADSSAKGANKVGAKVASAEPAYMSKQPNLLSGIALSYFGPMTVNSRAHGVNVEQGWFEYVANYGVHGPISEFEAEGKHFVDPFTFALKFYNKDHGSY